MLINSLIQISCNISVIIQTDIIYRKKKNFLFNEVVVTLSGRTSLCSYMTDLV